MKKYLVKLVDGTRMSICASNLKVSDDKFFIEYDGGSIMFTCTIAEVQFLCYIEDKDVCKNNNAEDTPRKISSELIDVYLDELYDYAISTGSYEDAVIMNHMRNSHVKYLPPFYTILTGRNKDKMIADLKHMFNTLIY